MLISAVIFSTASYGQIAIAPGWMAQSIIDAQADVVVILEVFNTRSNGNIGSYMTTLNAQIAVKELCSTVNTKDKPSTWTYEISGGNAG